jgi:hypothetical protein
MARSTVAILNTSPATVPGDYHAPMTLTVFLAALAQERDNLSASAAWRELSRSLRVPFPFESHFTTVLAPYALVASVLSQQHNDGVSRPVGRPMALVDDPRWTGVPDAPKFASRRRHSLPAPA